jgi:imidazole glycerol-phosphate synthase subunit HisH
MKSLVIVDYGMGNLRSVANALKFLKVGYEVSSEIEKIEKADAYLLPGVGSFSKAIANLNATGVSETLTHQVTKEKKPIMGICLGMQLMANDSEEGGSHKGLNWIDGKVRKINSSKKCELPHVGWNNVKYTKQEPYFDRIDNSSDFYFDHSYQFECNSKYVLATCDYGIDIVAAVNFENIFAVQFHPEKSQSNGLKLIRNFLNTI